MVWNSCGWVSADVFVLNRKVYKKEVFLLDVISLFAGKKEGVERMKHYVFKEIKKFKIQRQCKGCGGKIVVENANRYYCDGCRGL